MELARQSSMRGPLLLLTTTLLIGALDASSADAQRGAPSGTPAVVRPWVTISGTSYTVSATGANGTLGVASADARPTTLQNYIGHVVFAAGRGRMDIVEGGVDALFVKGDYVLFDKTDVIVVHPGAREYIAIPRDLASRGAEQLGSLGVHLALTDERVTLDSVSAGDTIAGLPTRHYRMTVAFNLAMNADVVQQRVGMESVTDYWVSASPAVPSNPLLRANGFAAGSMPGGMFRSLGARVDSAAAKMGTMTALKTKAVTRFVTGPGGVFETQQLYEVANIAPCEVDENSLIIPAGLSAAGLSGERPLANADSIVAKWRVPPGGRTQSR